MIDNIFLQVSVLMAIAVAVAFIVRLLGQPLIIAYIVAGITAGPMFFNMLHQDQRVYDAFAQFGVALLLFIIGLNLNFKHLKSIGKNSFITGVGQIIFTAVIGFAILTAMKMEVLTAVYLSVAITFSSTIIIMKLLTEKKDTETVYGRHTIGLMIVQDVIAVLLMVVVGLFTNENPAQNSASALAIKGILSLVAIIIFSKYLLPWLLNKAAHSTELLFIFTVAWCFGLGSLFYLLGFSIEIGAIIAGITLSSSPYQPEIASRIKPLRDFFLIIFFIVLGGTMAVGSMGPLWLPALILSLFILIGNPLILYFLFRILKFTRRNSFFIGLAAAQVSEFGFVILFTGSRLGHINNEVIPIFTIVAIATIFISSYLILYSEKLYQFLLPVFNWFGPDKYLQTEILPPVYDAWVVGYDRIGRKVCQALRDLKFRFSVIDFDPRAIKQLKEEKVPAIFGDIADVELLESLPLASASLIVMTIPSTDDQINLLNQVRKVSSETIVLANAYHAHDVKVLYEAGADYVMMPYVIGGEWVAKILKENKFTPEFFSVLKTKQLRELKAQKA
jgi:Kef-type K+ transport system membrane component KefB